MVLVFGQIATNSDGTGTIINLGTVEAMVPLLGNGNFNKSLPFTKSSEKVNLNVFGTTRKLRIVGTVSGADVATFVSAINAWYDERQSIGRYCRTKFDSTVRRYTIETARLPEVYATDIIKDYEIILVEGKN